MLGVWLTASQLLTVGWLPFGELPPLPNGRPSLSIRAAEKRGAEPFSAILPNDLL